MPDRSPSVARRDLCILRGPLATIPPACAARQIAFAELRGWLRNGSFLRHLWAWRDVTVWTKRPADLPRPFLTLLLARLLARGAVRVAGPDDRGRRIGLADLLRLGLRCAAVYAREASLVASLGRLALALERPRPPARKTASGPLYLRTDVWQGVVAGGSVGHIAGVVNQLQRLRPGTRLASVEAVPTVDPAVPLIALPLATGWLEAAELTAMAGNASGARALAPLLDAPPALIYQRCSLHNLLGLWLSRRTGAPFICEYNGPEAWIARHWGNPLRHAAFAESIESANLRGADLVVVVSEAMRAEVAARGVPAERILVSPNGVDVLRYRPDIDGGAARERYGLRGKMVVGFIGTFGPWHGVEVLVEAFAAARRLGGNLEVTLHLMLIGDGAAMPAVRALIDKNDLRQAVVCTGLVAQKDGPDHLAACDILVNPTVGNPDGSPFFGSPTKLFEYLAMGRAVISSAIGQAGEIIVEGETGRLVPPGDVLALARTLAELARDPEQRRRLGAAARRAAMGQHRWEARVDQILEALPRESR